MNTPCENPSCSREQEYTIKLPENHWVKLCAWCTLQLMEPDLFDPEKVDRDV